MQSENTFVIEQDEHKLMTEDGLPHWFCIEQGTAFLLKGIGYITNYHVIKDYIKYYHDGYNMKTLIRLHRPEYPEEDVYVTVKCYDRIKDIAILVDLSRDIDRNGFKYSLNDVSKDSNVQLLGFPHYHDGNPLRQDDTKIIGRRNSNEISMYEVESTIFGGNSGGPLVNENNEVVGLAVKGSVEYPNEAIPIVHALELNKNEKRNVCHT
ncbi:serine protease [Salicibibacter halophilus]|uniref:Serine protease n=1 Tax=Salicibibacter halophilus TaxID=2502791 RepID=A0A514LF05_9BACI|nr:serine protease [Salicibibacter halophilus]QDI90438.1 serine protease [Salicibibacter halophilus]